MALLLPDKYTWDAWFLAHKQKVHSFFLESEKNGVPEQRRLNNVGIGYATSDDLYNWKYHGCVLSPSEWYDAVAIWSGCIFEWQGKYYMYYTGRYGGKKDTEDEKQCICVAISDDLITWKKYEKNPLLVPDGKIYSTDFDPNKYGRIGAFRDPFVFEEKGVFYMTFSARTPGNNEFNACIGFAKSTNLLDWELLDPILAPSRYDEMEVSQVIRTKGHVYILFSVPWSGQYHPNWQAQVGEHLGLHGYYSKDLNGPFIPVNDNGVILDDAQDVYDIQFLHYKENTYGIGWNNMSFGLFLGGISDPFVFHFNGHFVGVMKPVVTPKVPVNAW